MRWEPTLAFLNRGEACVRLPWQSEPMDLVWSFQIAQKRTSLFQLVECTLKTKDKTVSGFSVRPYLAEAMKIALAEAWERLVFLLYRDEESSPVQCRISSTGYAAGASEYEASCAAQYEYWERLLLLKATAHYAVWSKYTFQGLYNRSLVYYLEHKYGALLSFLYTWEGKRILLAWIQGSDGIRFDSLFLDKHHDEVKRSRALLLSLLGSPGVRLASHAVDSQIENMSNLHSQAEDPQTKILYAGGALPPVSVAFPGQNTGPFVAEFSPDAILLALISKHTKFKSTYEYAENPLQLDATIG